MSEKTAVYRIFDAADALLYIGVAKSFGKRWQKHAQVQPWWPDVARQTVEWHPDRAAALDAEKAAIGAEGPRYNVVHVPRPPRRPRPRPRRPATDEEAPLADPAADWWTMDDIAAYLGIEPESARRYRSRPVANGGLPAEDRMIGRTPAWRPATITAWKRPGRGARTDLSRAREE